jgi:hypothetical protein
MDVRVRDKRVDKLRIDQPSRGIDQENQVLSTKRRILRQRILYVRRVETLIKAAGALQAAAPAIGPALGGGDSIEGGDCGPGRFHQNLRPGFSRNLLHGGPLIVPTEQRDRINLRGLREATQRPGEDGLIPKCTRRAITRRRGFVKKGENGGGFWHGERAKVHTAYRHPERSEGSSRQ